MKLVTEDGDPVPSTEGTNWLPLPCGHRRYTVTDESEAHWVKCRECGSHYNRSEVKE